MLFQQLVASISLRCLGLNILIATLVGLTSAPKKNRRLFYKVHHLLSFATVLRLHKQWSVPYEIKQMLLFHLYVLRQYTS